MTNKVKILKLIDSKDISINFLLNFILKRIERLLPAILVIILFTSLISYFYLLPDEIIFLKELPHGATGKLQKFELRDEYTNYYMENKNA